MALVPDQKFSTFQDGGDLAVDDIVVGLRGGINTKFNYTGELPPGVVVPIANGGTGATTAAGARTNLGLGTMAVQDANAVAITGGSAALDSGSVIAAPIAGIDLANKTYVDSVVAGSVTSGQGTANQVLVNGTSGSAQTGALIFTLPQSIATTSTPIFLGFNDSNNVAILRFATTASAVNHFLIKNNAAASNPVLASEGADTDIGQSFLAKGAGLFRFITLATNVPVSYFSGSDDGSGNPRHRTNFSFSDTAQTRTVTFQDADGTVAYLSDVAGAVTSITGTANQVLANGTSGSAQTGAVTLTLPQSIATTSAVQFNTVQFNSNNGLLDSNGNILLAFSPQALAVNYVTLFNGASGVNPAFVATGGNTNINFGFQSKGTGEIRFASASTTAPVVFETGTAFQHITQFNFSNTAQTRTATFQDSNGTVAWLTDIPSVTPSALTKTDDTNVTLTLGGSPTVALLAATSLTLGWTGQLGLTRGGTAASLTASNGGIVYSNASTLAVLSGTATAQQLLLSGASTTPQWSTTTYPLTNAVNTLLYASSANVMSALATANSGVLVTSAGGVPSISSTLPAFTTSSITFNPSTSGIVGTTTNNSASSGFVGEFISTTTAVGSKVSLTSATPAEIANIALTAGDWDISWCLIFEVTTATSVSNIRGGANAATATVGVSTINASQFFTSFTTFVPGAVTWQVNGAQCRQSLSGAATIYLNAQSTFSISTLFAYGWISARRVR